MNICIIGQSKRLSILEENLKNLNFRVRHLHTAEHIKDPINDKIVVLPIPTVSQSGSLNINGENAIYPDKVLSFINPEAVIISCGYNGSTRKIFDLNQREDFAYLNAVPTAEGAILYALENTERSLFENNILITGFGRVAKLLADRIKGLCKNITIAARSDKDLAYAKALSFNTLHINNLENYISSFNLVFQTVPGLVLTPNLLNCMDKDSTIIELSSKSVGTDYEYAKTIGIKVVHAPALPEKISPITAGNILTKSVLSIISEQIGSVYSE